MKSNVRLTRQGIPDLNYYGPRQKPVAPVKATPGTIPEEVASPTDEAAKVAEAPRNADVSASSSLEP
jgi:hypothetical protein